MLKNRLEKLQQQVLKLHGFYALNLLSCMTLDFENLHFFVHHRYLLFKGHKHMMQLYVKYVQLDKMASGGTCTFFLPIAERITFKRVGFP